MSDATLQSRFEQAVKGSTELSERPDNANLLKIYALYKQATEGDTTGERPGFADMRGRFKYDAWEKLKGMSKETAMQEYIDLIESLS